ncbi:BREX-1 system phosphatase PglZ type B [Bordetella petrii]|nr:BREX-1 system phosphatase PglZ type B [Bordetella petrii]
MTEISAKVIAAIQAVAKGNTHTAAPAAAVLWPDKEEMWQSAIPELQQAMPTLLVFGAYNPEQRSGPAIWLKCAIAGLLNELAFDGVPVIYLPGVSRADLRAIENCPRELQPLAELQYRGTFWSQANAKDWTIAAFLSSKNGGLGFTVSQDRATLEALRQALEAGVLLNKPIEDFEGRSINAEWLLSLMAPNPSRDLLAWMNAPADMQKQWAGVRWSVFVQRCQTDYRFDPLADGELVAAEKLAQRQGKWAAVAELYADSYLSFPHVFELLNKVQPPDFGLFPDPHQQAAYPQINENNEAVLRYALSACASQDAEQARQAILNAEREHGLRRDWLWSRMGRAPLAQALYYLATVAELSQQLPSGNTPSELAESYQQAGWQVDDAAMQALAQAQSKADTDAIADALRAVYLPWLQEAARRLQEAARNAGGLPRTPAAVLSNTSGICTVFVDGLRYDAAQRLKERLSTLGSVQLDSHWSSMPSVTASGKPWSSPVAAYVVGQAQDTEFEPRVAADGKPLSAHHFKRLLTENGIQPLDKSETGDPQSLAWTEAGDLDHYGHQHGIRLARDMDGQLAQIVERIEALCQAGWQTIRIVTDHGWLLVPGGLPKSVLPSHQAETRWGRCAVLKDSAHGTSLTFDWSWSSDVQVAYAPGVSSFISGAEYAHGGLSLQECLVPVIELRSHSAPINTVQAKIVSVVWKGLRCVVQVETDANSLTVDIRTRPAQAESSIVATVKPLESGKANVAVANDEHEGAAAVVVVLAPDGSVVQKHTTTVGEN